MVFATDIRKTQPANFFKDDCKERVLDVTFTKKSTDSKILIIGENQKVL